jgi:hypothetical protein
MSSKRALDEFSRGRTFKVVSESSCSDPSHNKRKKTVKERHRSEDGTYIEKIDMPDQKVMTVLRDPKGKLSAGKLEMFTDTARGRKVNVLKFCDFTPIHLYVKRYRCNCVDHKGFTNKKYYLKHLENKHVMYLSEIFSIPLNAENISFIESLKKYF